MKTIVLTGGGTAGHVIPSLSLVEDLKEYFDNIYYMGEKGGIEEKLSREAGLQFFGTDAVKFDRRKIATNLKIPYKLLKSINQAKKILKEIKPDVIFAKGGYASLPSALSARSVGAKLIIHESDMSLGLANKLCYPFADKVLTSFEGTCKNEIVVGTPLRKQIFEGKNPNIIFGDDKPIVLIMGGSSGSKTINECVKKSLDNLDEYNIIHIVGKSPINVKRSNYYSQEYYSDIQDLYHIADVVVSRAGANTLAEIVALGKKALVIPLPKTVSRGDQILNARYYQNRGFVDVLQEENLTPENLVSGIKCALNRKNSERIENNANLQIVREIEKSIK